MEFWSKDSHTEQFPKLHDIIERIVARNNLPKPKIAVINTNMPNAFATGKGPKSSVVAVTTGIMRSTGYRRVRRRTGTRADTYQK